MLKLTKDLRIICRETQINNENVVTLGTVLQQMLTFFDCGDICLFLKVASFKYKVSPSVSTHCVVIQSK